MRPVWHGRETLIFEFRKVQTAVHSTRYVAYFDSRTWRGRKFDLYIPDEVFEGLEPPDQVCVTIESQHEIKESVKSDREEIQRAIDKLLGSN